MEVAYASARDRLGQTLCGKYHLDEVLGVGGTAVVFRATHRNGNQVAVKLLHDHLCKSRDITRRFMREAYLANLLEHPGTVRVLDDDTDDDGVAFLVLELLEGETLEERRVRLGGRLVVDEVLGYADRLLEVLELAHEKQIVHRDIKPSNLFLTKDGTLKVLDFGIARMLDQTGSATSTKTGQMIGTPAFMPPEQALSKPKDIDRQTDLWATGATIFTLLSGELVHQAESSSEHLVKAATEPARSVARVLPGVPANVEALVGRALRFEKKERWASATEMRRELWRVRLEPGRPVGTTSAPPPPFRPSSDYPTVVGKRDSDKSELRELGTGMAVSGAYPVTTLSQRARFVSTAIAILLVASALAVGIYMVVATKPLVARAVAAAPPPAPSPVPAPVPIETGEPRTGAPANADADANAKANANAAPSSNAAAVAPSKPVATAVTKPATKRAPTTPNGDIYKPF